MKFEKNGCVACANLREELETMKYYLGVSHNKMKYANDLFKYIIKNKSELGTVKTAEFLFEKFDPFIEFLEDQYEFLKPTQESTHEL